MMITRQIPPKMSPNVLLINIINNKNNINLKEKSKTIARCF